MTATAALPQAREMVPDFLLSATTGSGVRLSDFRGRRNLVLAFVAGGDRLRELVGGLASRQAELEEEDTRVFVIFTGDMAAGEALRKREAIPFTVLADPESAVHARYGGGRGALVITDRYGEIYGVWREEAPPVDDVMASLRHINAACPE